MGRNCHCGGKLYKVFGMYSIWDVTVPSESYICVECGEEILSHQQHSKLDSKIMFALRDLAQKLKEDNQTLQNLSTNETRMRNYYVDKVVYLKEQLEKMKCCGNCKHSQFGYVCAKPEYDCDGIDKWEIIE